MTKFSKPFRIAVFASGSGSNFQAIVDAIQSKQLDACIGLLVCDRPQAKVVERAEQAGVPVLTFRPKDFENREAYEQMIQERLEAEEIDLIVLAGYMRIITNVLVDAWYGRMINIHPSLLPSFPGVDGMAQALAHGVKVTGVTVHFVDGGLDSGPIIAQRALAIAEQDTLETLALRVHALEHELYPEVIGWFAANEIQLTGNKVRINSK